MEIVIVKNLHYDLKYRVIIKDSGNVLLKDDLECKDDVIHIVKTFFKPKIIKNDVFEKVDFRKKFNSFIIK